MGSKFRNIPQGYAPPRENMHLLKLLALDMLHSIVQCGLGSIIEAIKTKCSTHPVCLVQHVSSSVIGSLSAGQAGSRGVGQVALPHTSPVKGE